MRDRRKGGFLLAAGILFVAVSVFVKDSYSAFMGNSMGSNRFFASERIFLL